MAAPILPVLRRRRTANTSPIARAIWPVAPYLVAAADLADDDPVGPHAERGLRTRSRTDTSPLPSTFDGRASSDSTYGLALRSSAASSMVTSRSPMDPEICELICRMAKENSR